MRYLSRGLLYAVLAALSFLLLANFFFFDSGITDRVQELIHDPVNDPLPALEHDDIRTLWAHWSQFILEAKPLVPEIQLSARAPNIHVDTKDNATRNAFTELVINHNRAAKSLAKSHKRFKQELDRLGEISTIFTGYGVALVAGGEYFGPAISTIQMLRRSGSQLPVEVFVADNSEYEKELCDVFLPKLNAKCLIITDFLSTPGSAQLEVRKYQLKALALLFTSFKHVLFLDSDSIPLMDPYQQLMKSDPYLSRGMVIWPDFWMSTESPSFWTIAGKKDFPSDLPVTSSETGQIMVNKGTHLKAVLLATYYNIWGPGWYYPLLSQGAMGQGDKETFMAAAVATDLHYYRVREKVVAVMNDDGEKSRGRAMLQHHAGDDYANARQFTDNYMIAEPRPVRPFFLHANIPKMNVGHLMDEGDIFSEEDKAKRWRLLGTKENQMKTFGFDVEATLWELMETTGCELQDKLNDWKPRERLCERIHEHVQALIHGQVTTVKPAEEKAGVPLEEKKGDEVIQP
ncbi:mannosyltransferase putative-domain-containing protein [Elsinoe ampelina]|uniref:Mannosyltransferase putative-domain-containing protein n=1 Tax=Elsinoe ampelina TaxID=302913 RepID=A0A6A6G0J3_9PEZI|nr:mannosyltransferase putative-domain-containing protein [Elsinoe ampelina]